MKIFSISRIKNEEDIIESFIRYHLNFLDGMVIIEDYSNDETYNILQKLKSENLPIHIHRNSKQPIPQQEVINNAFNIALNDFTPDVIVPLDCDEFLVCKDGGNPRDVLEKLSSDKYYQVFWRTYLPDLEEKSFSLNQLKTIRDPFLDDRSKIIIPTGLTEEYDIVLTAGSHSLEDKDIPFEELDELRIAHIPVRNKNQCISKEVNSWLNNISYYYKDPRASWHQNEMFKLLKDTNGNLTDEQLFDYVKTYSTRKTIDGPIEVLDHPFDLSFCGDLDLKYTQEYNLNETKNILEFTESQALELAKANQMLADVNEDILNNSTCDSNYLYTLEDAYTHVKKQLYFKENDLIINNKKFTGRIEVKNERITELKEQVKSLKIELRDLKKENKQLKNENASLKRENENLTKTNEEIMNSNSWKLTKPLRR